MYGCLINKPAGIKPLFSELETPISPPTSENRFTNVRLSVRVGGLLGLSGIDIRQFINTVPTAGKLSIFSNIDKGIVLVSILETGMIGRYDALISIIDRNNIRVESYNAGQDSGYQIFAINDGVLSISNSGYGIGKFIAYYFG